MKMKKLLSMVLALAMLISMMSGMTAFAVWEDAVTLFEADFENETVGEAPRTVNGASVIATTTDAEVLQGEEGSENASKFMNVKGNNKVRMWFNEPVSEGTIVAEFDLNGGQYGNVYLGLVYESNSTIYSKYPLFLSGPNVKSNTSTGTTGDYVTSFTRKADDIDMQITSENWHNYKVKIDLTNKTVKAWVDGVESNLITDYTYFIEAIGGMAFYVGKSENKSWIDNVKIYKENSYGRYYVDHDFEAGKLNFAYNSPTDIVSDETISNAKPGQTNTTKYLDFAPTDKNSKMLARIMFKYDSATGKPTEISTGKLFVEFDVLTSFGGVSVGVVHNDEEKYDSYTKNIWASGTYNSTPKRGLKAYTKKYDGTTSTSVPPSGNAGSKDYIIGYRAVGATSDMVLSDKVWHHVKLEIDNDANSVKCTLDGVESQVVTGFDYLDEPIAGLGFRCHPMGFDSTSTLYSIDSYLDNVKVYTVSNGASISDTESGSNVIRVTLKDTISAITPNDITVTDAIGTLVAVSNVELGSDNKTIFVTLAETPEEGDAFIVTLADSLKYADGYDIVTKTTAFDYSKGTFTVYQPTIETISFTKGDEVKAKCVIDAYDFSNNTVKLYIATYNGGILKDVNVKDISVDYKTYGEIIDTVSVTLTDDATLLKAFVWDNNLIPYVTEAEETPEA